MLVRKCGLRRDVRRNTEVRVRESQMPATSPRSRGVGQVYTPSPHRSTLGPRAASGCSNQPCSIFGRGHCWLHRCAGFEAMCRRRRPYRRLVFPRRQSQPCTGPSAASNISYRAAEIRNFRRQHSQTDENSPNVLPPKNFDCLWDAIRDSATQPDWL